MEPPITVRVYEEEGPRSAALREAWEACLQACPPEQSLFTYEWFRAWHETYGRRAPWSGHARVLVATDAGGQPCAILPLAHSRHRGLRLLSLAGLYQPLRTLVAVPATAPAACAALVQHLHAERRRWDLLRLAPIDRASPEREALIAALESGAGPVESTPLGRTVVNNLQGSMEAYESTHAVKKMRYYERRFARDEQGDVRHYANPSPAETADLIPQLRAVEERSWLAREGGDLRFGTEADTRFWSLAAAETLTPRGQWDIWVARAAGRPVAFRLVLTAGSRSYLIANQYDEQYAKHSPGWILFLHNLEAALARGVRCIDSAPGDLHYKSRLGGEEAEMRIDVKAYPRTAKGLLTAGGLRALGALRSRLARSGKWGGRLAAGLPRV